MSLHDHALQIPAVDECSAWSIKMLRDFYEIARILIVINSKINAQKKPEVRSSIMQTP